MKLNAPIPGMSLTKEPGNSPWEQPPLHDTPEKALAFYLEKLDDEETLDDLLFALEAGYPVDAMVDFLTSYSVMEGYHSFDVKMLLSPLLHEYIINLADAAGVEYQEELGPSKEGRMAAKEKKRTHVLLTKALEADSPAPSSGNIQEASDMLEEAPVEGASPILGQPLIPPRSAPTETPAGPFVDRRPPPPLEEVDVEPVEMGEVAEPLVEKTPPPKKPKPPKSEGRAFAKLDLGESPVPSHPSIGEVLKGISVGDWKTVGAPIKAGPYKGQRPLGKYQVMPANLKKWIKSATERDYTKEEFLRSSEIQQAVAMSAIVNLKNQHGSWEDAVSAWFTNKPVSGISVPEEADLVRGQVMKFRDSFKRV